MATVDHLKVFSSSIDMTLVVQQYWIPLKTERAQRDRNGSEGGGGGGGGNVLEMEEKENIRKPNFDTFMYACMSIIIIWNSPRNADWILYRREGRKHKKRRENNNNNNNTRQE